VQVSLLRRVAATATVALIPVGSAPHLWKATLKNGHFDDFRTERSQGSSVTEPHPSTANGIRMALGCTYPP
jgi:hypothetical protein